MTPLPAEDTGPETANEGTLAPVRTRRSALLRPAVPMAALGQILGFALILAGVGLALTRSQTPGHPRQHRLPDRKPEPPDDLMPVPQRDPAA